MPGQWLDLKTVMQEGHAKAAQLMPWQPVVMFAKYSTPCSRCHLPISVGNSIYPWQDYDGYQHLKCALQEAEEQGVPLQPPVSMLAIQWHNAAIVSR